MFDWDIEEFQKSAAPTPGQRDAERWLAEHPEQEMRPVTQDDIRRLMDRPDDPRDQDFAVSTSGGGHERQRYTPYGSEGYNQEGRSYPGQEEHEPSSGGYHMPGITHPEDFDEDEEYEQQPVDYHIVTRPRGAIPGLNAYTEHQYTMFEHPDFDDYDTDAAWRSFEEDHPDHDVERYPNSATHEVVHVHPAEDHDIWRNQMRSEDEAFSRISPHGFERESPEYPGHMAYRHVDPHGGIHRLWHNETRFTTHSDGDHGPGWKTSYWREGVPSEQQVPWTFHDDDTTGDSLGDALERVERNKAHADVVHSDTGLRPVENSYGRHYVSQRPDGSTQQLLYNQGRGEDSNWMLAHYHPQDPNNHSVTYHGSDLPGALEQARRNLARG